jgi:hypothetical protein
MLPRKFTGNPVSVFFLEIGLEKGQTQFPGCLHSFAIHHSGIFMRADSQGGGHYRGADSRGLSAGFLQPQAETGCAALTALAGRGQRADKGEKTLRIIAALNQLKTQAPAEQPDLI